MLCPVALRTQMVNRELTLKCRLKCYVKPMKDAPSVSPGKGNRESEKNILTSVGIESTTSGLDLPLLCRLSYEAGQRTSGTIKVVNSDEEKVSLHRNV